MRQPTIVSKKRWCDVVTPNETNKRTDQYQPLTTDPPNIASNAKGHPYISFIFGPILDRGRSVQKKTRNPSSVIRRAGGGGVLTCQKEIKNRNGRRKGEKLPKANKFHVLYIPWPENAWSYKSGQLPTISPSKERRGITNLVAGAPLLPLAIRRPSTFKKKKTARYSYCNNNAFPG